MTLRKLLGVARRWLFLLVLGPVVAAAVALVFLRLTVPIYESTVTLLIVPANAQDDPTRGAEQLGRTYTEVVQTRAVLEQAASQVGLTLPYTELRKRVDAKLVANTQLLRITAEDPNPERAAAFANTLADVFMARTTEAQASRYASSRDNLSRSVDSLRADIDSRTAQLERLRGQASSPERDAEILRLQGEVGQLQSLYASSVRSLEELRITEARGSTTTTVLEPAIAMPEPASPKPLVTMLLAVLGGFAVAAAAAALAEYLDDGLADRRRVASATGLVTLGSVPRITDFANARAMAERRFAESFRLLLTNLQVAVSQGDVRTLLVTSPGMGEGKSTTASQLATVLAQSGKRVILVDADLYRPTLNKIFNLSRRSGFSTLLLNPSESPRLEDTAVAGLRVMTAGPALADPSALLSSEAVDRRIAQLRDMCDVLIFDTPPLLAQPDAALLAPRVDGVLLVLDASKTRGRVAAQALEMLQGAGATVIGAVLNRVPRKSLDYMGYGEYELANRSEPVAELPAEGEGSEDDPGRTQSVRPPATAGRTS